MSAGRRVIVTRSSPIASWGTMKLLVEMVAFSAIHSSAESCRISLARANTGLSPVILLYVLRSASSIKARSFLMS